MKAYSKPSAIPFISNCCSVLFVDTEEYECIHDILLAKTMCSELQSHVTSLNFFWEISDNISETVQDRDIVAMED